MDIKSIYTVVMAFCVTMGSYAQGDIKWDYPVKPGTEEWRSLTTYPRMLEACRIPDDVLAAMPTDELLEVCLRYPLMGEVFMKDNIQEGMRAVAERFNGLEELFGRESFASSILDSYRKERLPERVPEEPSEYFRMMYLELMVSSPEFLKALNDDERTAIMKEAIRKIDGKRDLGYSVSYQSTSALILSHALSLSGHDGTIRGDIVLDLFDRTGMVLSPDIIEKITDMTIRHLADHEK